MKTEDETKKKRKYAIIFIQGEPKKTHPKLEVSFSETFCSILLNFSTLIVYTIDYVCAKLLATKKNYLTFSE